MSASQPSAPPGQSVAATLEHAVADIARVRDEIARRIVGQRSAVESCLVALLAGGHVLLEGVPGLGKTELVKTLARTLDLRFSRIQFTPDMLPTDITGTHVLVDTAGGGRTFDFRPGPIFANIVLADEINRATPKTQSALLEAMQERSVTVGRDTLELDEPFLVIATQNPIEMEGTYPLPEAQVDRFLFKVQVVFPEPDDLGLILDRTTGAGTEPVLAVLGRERILEIRRLGMDVQVTRAIRDLVVRLIYASHPDRRDSPEPVRRFVRYGASPRGGQAVLLGAKFRALIAGRLHVSEEDIRDVLEAALRHRVLLNFEGEAEGVRPDDVIEAIGASVRLEQVL